MKEVTSMKKNDIFPLLYKLITPIALILLGAILLLSPDTASAVIARVLGWCIFLTGIGFGISGILGHNGTAGKILTAIICIGVGGTLIRNPLILAANIGRFIGLLLLIRGVRDFFQSNHREARVLSVITAVLGVVLIALPMTTSRLVFSLLGLALLLIGVAILIDRIRDHRRLDSGNDKPDIIDAL